MRVRSRLGDEEADERFCVPHATVNGPRSEVVRTRRTDDARNAFSIRTRSDHMLEAFRDLGVDFPATDWRFAWLRVDRLLVESQASSC